VVVQLGTGTTGLIQVARLVELDEVARRKGAALGLRLGATMATPAAPRLEVEMKRRGRPRWCALGASTKRKTIVVKRQLGGALPGRGGTARGARVAFALLGGGEQW
jgi:hypothetical protein